MEKISFFKWLLGGSKLIIFGLFWTIVKDWKLFLWTLELFFLLVLYYYVFPNTSFIYYLVLVIWAISAVFFLLYIIYLTMQGLNDNE
jgi:hypothetical protein